MKILFLHGWNSVPAGVKPSYLAQHGHEVINPALSDDDFGEAIRTAQAEHDRHRPDVIVGSSRGGAFAMICSTVRSVGGRFRVVYLTDREIRRRPPTFFLPHHPEN